MSVIIDRTGLNESFARMAAVDLRLRDDDALTALRRTLTGDTVPILEQRLGGDGGGTFAVVWAGNIPGTGINLYGVCLADKAGRGQLVAEGLMDPAASTHELLGQARAEAIRLNTTVVRSQYGAHLAAGTATRAVPGMGGL